MNMYVADARYFADACLYRSNFTPPTAPLGATGGSAYSLNAARYESKSFNILTQNPNVTGVEISTDGTKAYTVDQTNDAVYEYDLSTAFDISTASYNSVSFSVASQEATPREVRFKPDGTRMFVVGATTDTVYQYDLSTAWDISSASYNSVGFSVASEENTPNGMSFSADGTYMYIAGQSGDDINQYSLTSAWDVSTASFDNKTLSVSSEETTPQSIEISSDGTQMFMLGSSADKVHQYTLSTAYDISTGSLTTSITPEATNPKGIAFKPDGTKFYIVGPVDDEIKQYSVFSSDATVRLKFQDASIPDLSGIDNIYTGGDAHVAASDPTKYGSNALKLDGTGDGLSSPETTSFGFSSSDFTIEAWAYLTTNGVFNNIFSAGIDSSNGYRLDISTSNNLRFIAYIGGSWTTVITGSTSLATGQWYHLAVTRNGNNFDLWVDGSSDATTVSNSGTITEPTTKIEIGAVTTNSLNRSFNGYLDDLRVTKGVARYAANFTPPIKALPKR
jgi:sugar lactone lactonase YvrE